MEKRISVRGLVEFILRSGSLDSRFTGTNRMEEGARIHRKLQKDAGSDYLKEVHLSITERHGGVTFTVEGRADGVIVPADGSVTIDEIKSTLTPLEQIGEDFAPEHWAQAMCYAYIYCVKNELESINIRLTYYEMESGEIKRFLRASSLIKLRGFFQDLLERYAEWAVFEQEWHETAAASMKTLEFPFESYREGQRKLAAAVYKTIASEGRLLAMAPTGIGKTVSTLFPAVKAVGEGFGRKIFYLTAKTITRQAAQAALGILRARGLRIKSATITAKDKICFLEERVCRPEYCKYADGHFDRINDALMDALRSCDDITAETVALYAERHRVCPFELSLDLTLWSDVIICDYNYLFDPLVYLKRFFADGGDYIFLIDEAHNLADRAREMFSASVNKSDFLAAKKLLGKHYKKLRSSLTQINKHLLEKRKECETAGFIVDKDPPRELVAMLEAFSFEFSKWLGENPEPDKTLLELYWNTLTFIHISELFDERYRTLFEANAGGLSTKLFCADPSHLLDVRLGQGRAAVFFSATLMPPGYYASVLGCRDDFKYIALPSPFPRENLLLLVAPGISTKYKDRERSLTDVADIICRTAAGKTGNYIAYFPSYSYLSAVHSVFSEKYPDVKTVSQHSRMTEEERDDFLARFEGGGDETLVAFCVLGGVFSEGVDLIGDRLIGTVIVGVGLPQLNTELDIVRSHYDADGEGFDFAYRFPGMNKVLQAAGRVIRSGSDCGVVMLIDDRFASRRYTELFPEHWHGFAQIRNLDDLTGILEAFWRSTDVTE